MCIGHGYQTVCIITIVNIHTMVSSSAVLSKEASEFFSSMAELESNGEDLDIKNYTFWTSISYLVPRNPCFAKHVATEIKQR